MCCPESRDNETQTAVRSREAEAKVVISAAVREALANCWEKLQALGEFKMVKVWLSWGKFKLVKVPDPPETNPHPYACDE